MRLDDILDCIKTAIGTENVSDVGNLGIFDSIGRFVSGISHDKNMRLMCDYYKEHSVDFTANDFFKENNMKHEKHFSSSLFETKHSAERYVHPTFGRYKMVRLD